MMIWSHSASQLKVQKEKYILEEIEKCDFRPPPRTTKTEQNIIKLNDIFSQTVQNPGWNS